MRKGSGACVTGELTVDTPNMDFKFPFSFISACVFHQLQVLHRKGGRTGVHSVPVRRACVREQ